MRGNLSTTDMFQNKFKYNTWQIATIALAVMLFGISLRWNYIDQSPPAWDESGYLVQATVFHQELLAHGLPAFLQQVFNYDRGRVMLIPLMVQPFFLLFGPTLRAAMALIDLFWFVLAWALYGLARDIAGPKLGNKAGFFAFAFFSLYPLTLTLSNKFLVEFPFTSFVAATLYSSLRFHLTHKKKWLWLTGVFLGLGMLTKVTFPAFILSLGILFVLEYKKTKNLFGTLKTFFPAYAIVFLIAGPYYIYNTKPMVAVTAFLSSSQLANYFDIAPVFDLTTIINYWKYIFIDPSMLVAGISSLIVIAAIAFSKKIRYMIGEIDFSAWLLSTWFCIPFVLCTFGTIKDIRYVYPALPPVFILFGLLISLFLERHIFIPIVVALFFLPSVQFLATNNFIRASDIPFKGLSFAEAPDPRDWKNQELVSKIGKVLGDRGLKKECFFLGGTRYYNNNQIRYYGLIANQNITFTILPYFTSRPVETETEAVEFVKNTPHSAILYKTGANFPEYFHRFDPFIIEKAKNDPAYENIDLGIVQPDGSRFFLLVRKVPWSSIAPLKEKAVADALTKNPGAVRNIVFAGRMKLIGAIIKCASEKCIIDIYWQSLRTQRNEYVNFVHLLDSYGNIIGQFDHPLDKGNDIVKKGVIWLDTTIIPRSAIKNAQSIGIGLFTHPSADDILPIDKTSYSTDWESHRLLIKLPL